MQVLEIITLSRNAGKLLRSAFMTLTLLGLLLAASGARGAAYYSTGAPVVATPTRTCSTSILNVTTCEGIAVNVSGSLSNGLALAGTVYVPSAGPAKLRLQLNGTALAGYRAGMLLSTTSATLGVGALGTVTIRTYLSTVGVPVPTSAQDARVVTATAAQVQIGAGSGQPQQFELISTKDFNQVEIEFGQALTAGTGVNVHYAYGIGQNASQQVPGYVSRFGSSATGQYDVSGSCAAGIVNPQNAVDGNLNNYAQFATIATVNCPGQLRVKLEGTAPASYKAGFVIGNTQNLLDADLLGGLTLRTYDAAGNPLQSGTGTSLLSLTALPDGKSYVSFQASQPFSYVSIERNGLVSVLDNLQLYYGIGVPSTTTTPLVLSAFENPSGHANVYKDGLLCTAGCGVSNANNAASANTNSPATIQQTVGLASAGTLVLDLNSPGQTPPGRAGNRAGMVIGNNSLLDLAALENMTLLTYDDAGNVLETATGSSLLALNVLPDGRRTVSFNTTNDFSKVGIRIGAALSVLASNDVYYAFADDSNGSLSFVPPTPLPVTLSSFGVRRLAGTGAAEIKWTTASEQNSAYFVVERSADPATGFQAIGQVQAAGSSLVARAYSLADNAAAPAKTLYYRLRQVDADGSAVLSGVAVLAASGAPASFSLYPNPATSSVARVVVSASRALVPGTSLDLYSSLGQLLSHATVGSTDSEVALTVPTAGLPAGVYHVVLRNAASQPLSSQRLVVAGN